MQWMYFVNHYDNWSGSTQKKHISETAEIFFDFSQAQ